MAQIASLELQDVSVKCKPAIRNFDSWTDQLQHFSYRFHSGKVYSIISQPNKGGWALSYLLSGRCKKFHGEIVINDRPISGEMIYTVGWYVGEGLKSGLFKKEMTVREQLERGTSINYSVDNLIDTFELSPSRLDREIRYISNERWNASAAIGLAYEKHVFCFPWLDDEWTNLIRGRLAHCSDVLRKSNKILLIPVSNSSKVEDFIDEAVYLT